MEGLGQMIPASSNCPIPEHSRAPQPSWQYPFKKVQKIPESREKKTEQNQTRTIQNQNPQSPTVRKSPVNNKRRKTVPEQISIPQAVLDLMLEEMDIPGRKLQPVDTSCWSREKCEKKDSNMWTTCNFHSPSPSCCLGSGEEIKESGIKT